MTYFLYSIYDRKAHSYSDMFVSPNHGTAIRDFNFLTANDPVKQHIKDDLELYCLGTFDSSTGKLTAYDNVEFISEAINEEK